MREFEGLEDMVGIIVEDNKTCTVFLVKGPDYKLKGLTPEQAVEAKRVIERGMASARYTALYKVSQSIRAELDLD